MSSLSSLPLRSRWTSSRATRCVLYGFTASFLRRAGRITSCCSLLRLVDTAKTLKRKNKPDDYRSIQTQKIKEQLEEKEGIPPPQQRLIYLGKTMCVRDRTRLPFDDHTRRVYCVECVATRFGDKPDVPIYLIQAGRQDGNGAQGRGRIHAASRPDSPRRLLLRGGMTDERRRGSGTRGHPGRQERRIWRFLRPRNRLAFAEDFSHVYLSNNHYSSTLGNSGEHRATQITETSS
jgi:hypothetical protein